MKLLALALAAAVATTVAATPKYTIASNVATTSPDLAFVESKTITIDTCRALCMTFPECGAYSINASGCALKKSASQRKVIAGTTSGMVVANGPKYIGCYQDRDFYHPGPRDLPVFFCSNGTDEGSCLNDTRVKGPIVHGNNYGAFAGSLVMTPAVCSALCTGFKYFGVQFSFACFCGDEYGQYGKLDESDCNSPCRGDSSTMCGGHVINSIYAQPSTVLNTTEAN
jgi:hypothetical protein